MVRGLPVASSGSGLAAAGRHTDQGCCAVAVPRSDGWTHRGESARPTPVSRAPATVAWRSDPEAGEERRALHLVADHVSLDLGRVEGVRMRLGEARDSGS